ncbi:MAG: phosphoadenosine phosphosulfate reductase family protein [Thermoprotei archaeon]|jgi:phosphoadenosine phosphosulfate reductase
MRKNTWPFKIKRYWCPNCNVPTETSSCSKCGGKSIKVSFSEPADIRPAFNGDLEHIKEALAHEFGTLNLFTKLHLENELVFINKTAHYDEMKEIIVNGAVVGRLYFDVKEMRWRWRLNYLSAKIAINEGLVDTIREEHVKPLEVLKGADNNPGKEYVVINSSNDPIALAMSHGNSVRVQTIFREKPEFISLKRSTFEDLLRANEYALKRAISRSVKHVTLMAEKVQLPLVVSYSGGKDSLVALDLTLEAGADPFVLFNDTNLELPETIKNVYDVVNEYSLDFEIVDAQNKFWESVSFFGPPARDYRWCCKVAKLAPISRFYKNRFPNGVLTIVGQRGFESIDRAKSGSVWRNRWIPSVLNISPIQEWDQLLVWMYAKNKKLNVNPLYNFGFERLGCYMCPAANIAEYQLIQKIHPELWDKWLQILKVWQQKLEMPEEWIRYHLWRWLNPDVPGRRRLEQYLNIKKSDWRKEYVKRSNISIDYNEENNRITLKVYGPPVLGNIIHQSKILNSTATIKENIKISSNSFKGEINNNTITFKKINNNVNLKEIAIKSLKIAIRWSYCVNCYNCATWCPTNAIMFISNKPNIILDRCRSCNICLEVCPISEVYVEKLLLPQILNKSRGRKRSESTAILLSKKSVSKVSPKEKELPDAQWFFLSLSDEQPR